MNKDNYRDYVADAYRYYALCGKPDAAKLRKLRTAQSHDYKGGMADLEAVVRVLERLDYEQDADIWKRCLDIVYFANPKHSADRGALTDRVRFASIELCISESTVYRMLRRLRLLLAMERGLRVDEREVQSLHSTIKGTPRSDHVGSFGTVAAGGVPAERHGLTACRANHGTAAGRTNTSLDTASQDVYNCSN